MEDNKSFFEKHWLLLIYLLFLGLDIYFLFTASYGSRIYSKPILMILLGMWFHRNTAMGTGVPPQSLVILFCIYAVFILSCLSDVCALWSDVIVWSVCRLLYIPIYILYLVLLIEVQRKAEAEKKIVFYIKRVFPTLGVLLLLATVVFYKAVGFGTAFYHWCLYLHALVICLLSAITANMWGYQVLTKCRVLFAMSISLIVLTNITFCFDELYYNRHYHLLDVLVALGNSAATILMLFGVLKVLKDWRSVEY